MAGQGSAAVLRPQGPVRRSRISRVAAAVAAAPFVAGAVLSGLSVRGPPAPLAVAETMVFVMPYEGLGLLRRGQVDTSRVALAADLGQTPTPGFRPQFYGEPKTKDDDDGDFIGETEAEQFDRVEKKRKWLSTLKGKFVPYGPKPWDKPRFLKVCIHVRLDAKQAANTKIMNQVVEELRLISGVHPTPTKAKKNIAALGWRVGYPSGAKVTLEGRRMNEFLQRLNTIILPRVRDFEGLYPTSVDNLGNFWMGFENQEPFRELDQLLDDREIVHGFHVGIINNCMTHPDGLKLMQDFGFPFGEPRAKKVKNTDPDWMRK